MESLPFTEYSDAAQAANEVVPLAAISPTGELQVWDMAIGHYL
jgi:hypothetical protein